MTIRHDREVFKDKRQLGNVQQLFFRLGLYSCRIEEGDYVFVYFVHMK